MHNNPIDSCSDTAAINQVGHYCVLMYIAYFITMKSYKSQYFISSLIRFVCKVQNENDVAIEKSRVDIACMIDDPTLEPICLSFQYISACTKNFTSKILGKGAFGSVYYGYDETIQLQFAVKRVPIQIMNQETMDKITLSFKREISVSY